MKTIDFLAKVLASEDNYVLFLARSTGATWNENYTDLADCAKAIDNHNKNDDTTVYMAVGAFADNVAPHPKTGRDYVQRRKHQATKFKALAIDLDVGTATDKYDTAKEAVTALGRACNAISLPLPMIVSSGTGAHAYWVFKKSINGEQWEKMSLALRAGLEAEGVKLDVSKVSDRSMVLRPVGSHHKKDPNNWKEVILAFDQPARDALEYAQPLAKFKTQPRAINTRRSKKKSAVLDALLDGGADIKLDDMKQCPQLEALITSAGAVDAAGNSVVEPLWRASLGIAKYCEDKEKAAERLSSGHPDYDFDICVEKMEGWAGTGPTNCSSFEDHCPSVCETCEHHGKITSPAQLAGGVTTVAITDPDTGENDEVHLPDGYSFKHGGIYYKHPIADEEVFVAPYLMWITSRVTDAEEESNRAVIAVVFPLEGIREISICSSLIAVGGNDLRKALAARQVYIKYDIDPLRNYLMTFLQTLQKAVAADVSYTHFGWQDDGTFLLGDKLIGETVVDTPHLDGVARAYKDRLCGKGDLDAWTKASRIFNLPGMEFQNFAVSLALGAPVHLGAHFPSALVNLYSGDSGSGKTLTGKFGLSAWGNPETIGLKAKDTVAAFYKQLGTLSSMGGYVDEMTTMDVDTLRAFIMCIQDGKERERVTKDASGFREAAHWRMPIITSSNKDMYELLGKSVASEAEQLRILQLSCPRVPYLKKHGTRIGYKLQILMEQNHGLAGPLFVEELIRRGGPQAVYEQMVVEFDRDFGNAGAFEFLGEERFYRGIIVDAYAGGRIYSELGLIDYDYRRGIEAVIDEIEVLRAHRDLQALDGFDVVSQFLTEKQSEIVYYTKTPTNQFARQPLPNSAVARVELHIDVHEKLLQGSIQINRAAFRKWASRNGAEIRSTIEKMRKEGAYVVDNARRTLYRGCQGSSASGQTRCIDIDVMSHKRLIAACDESVAEYEAVGRNRLEEVNNDG